MPMRTKTFAVLPAMYRLVGHGVAEVSLWEKFLPLLRGILQRLTIYRCRFCGELYRHWRHPPRKGVCPDCLQDTLAWLTELGCVVTWPLPDHK